MNIRELSWQEIYDLTNVMISSMKAQQWTPSVVVGITRGGLIPATLLSQALNIPMCTLKVSLRDALDSSPFSFKESTWFAEEIFNDHNILIVDDINDSGATFKWIKDDWTTAILGLLNNNPTKNMWDNIKFGALVHNAPSNVPSDFFGMEIDKSINPQWISYPWETWQNQNI